MPPWAAMLWARRGESWKQKTSTVIAEFAEGSGGRRAGQAGADHDDAELPLVRRVDQLHLGEALVPLLMQRAGWYFTVEDHLSPIHRRDAETQRYREKK